MDEKKYKYVDEEAKIWMRDGDLVLVALKSGKVFQTTINDIHLKEVI